MEKEGSRARIVTSNRIFVAVGKELSKYRLNLGWVFKNLWEMEVCIVYVHVPSQRGKEVPASQLGEEDLVVFRKQEKLEMVPMRNLTCITHTAKSIEEGIVEVISQNRVGRLIMGGASDTGYTRRMSQPTSTKANYVLQHAPKYCQLQFICRGREIYTREGVELSDSDVEERPSGMLETKKPVTGSVTEHLDKRPRDLTLELDNALKEVEQLRKQLAERTSPKPFSYYSTSVIENATNNFDASLIIAHGSSGLVYKGLLGDTEVAIKVLHPGDKHGPPKFKREIEALSNLRHPNLVTLVGACSESLALIYEYLPGGSLDDRLICKDNNPPLPWQTRIRIAIELSSIIAVLHSNESNGIIHGDIKPGNILLDENLVCKLSHFGICHLISTIPEFQDSHYSTNSLVTFFYMDPEFLTTGMLSKDSDVYSFGVILLQLLTGKQASSIMNPVKDAMASGDLNSILDPSAGEWPFVQAQDLARWGVSCCQMQRRTRPDIGAVCSSLKLIKASCTDSSMHHEDAQSYSLSPIFKEKLLNLEQERDNALKEAEKFRKQLDDKLSTLSTPNQFSLYSLLDLKNATNNFDTSLIIGEGGYGFIYKGMLGETEVAIKVPKPKGQQGHIEFQREIDALSNLRHPNLVTLVGACHESQGLIYGYVQGGNLEDRIICKDNSLPLSWQTRIKIGTQLCSVLVFLHSNSPESIIHGDLKPANILLDENMVCKLSDFGICHVISRTEEYSKLQSMSFFTRPRGTLYYMDPEFLTSGILSRRSDVYAFGIILLQLLTGREALGIAPKVQAALDSGDFKSILDPLAGEWPSDHHTKELADVALLCCQMRKNDRPDLVDVLRFLKLISASCIGLFSHQQVSDDAPPPIFLCPIFQEIMKDPHTAADGFTYEKKAIEGWLDLYRDSSPVTNKTLQHTDIVPNHDLRFAIQEWQQQNNTA